MYRSVGPPLPCGTLPLARDTTHRKETKERNPSPPAIPLNHAPSRARPRSRLLSHLPSPSRLRSPVGRGVGHTSAWRRQRAGAASGVRRRARARWPACKLRQAATLLHSSQIPTGSSQRVVAGSPHGPGRIAVLPPQPVPSTSVDLDPQPVSSTGPSHSYSFRPPPPSTPHYTATVVLLCFI